MSEGSDGFSEGEVELIAGLPAVNDLRQRLYPSGFRPVRVGPPLFSRANLEFHYWPFKGIVWSLVVHASIFTGMVSIPMITGIDERPRLEEAVILDADDMNVLFFPLLGADTGKSTDKKSENDSKVNAPASVKEGLSYPGVQPIFSEFPKPTNHIQTVLQPTLVNPPILQPSLAMPNLVRLAPPAVEAKFKVPDASAPQARQPSDPLTRLDAALSQPTRPLPAPAAEAKLKMPDSVNPAARPVVPVPVAQDVSLSGPLRPLAAPVAEPRFKVPDSVNPAARPVRARRSKRCFSVRPDSPLGRACRGTSVQASGSCCACRSTGANRARRPDTGAVGWACTAVGRTCSGIQAQGSRLGHASSANDVIRGDYESGSRNGTCAAARCSDRGIQIQSAQTPSHRSSKRQHPWRRRK